MKTKFTAFNRTLCLAITFALALSICLLAAPVHALAAPQAAPRYCDDGIAAYGDTSFFGAGESVNDDQLIYYDYRVIRENKVVGSVPSLGNADPSITNFCAPLTGANVATFYDRHFGNLLPDFEPGMTFANGIYNYYPDMKYPATKAALRKMYDLMGTNIGGAGTAYSGFKNGLSAFFSQAGYSLSYSSFFTDTKTVNLASLSSAIGNGKVGVVLLKNFNFVSGISHIDGQTTRIIKRNYNSGHIMMIYGYQIIDYYKNGMVFKTDTFLHAASGFSTGEKAFMRLNDYLSIDDALIVNIT